MRNFLEKTEIIRRKAALFRRMRRLSAVITILLSSYVYGWSFGDVVINELMWMGTSRSPYDEYVELRNRQPVADLPTKSLYVNFCREILPDPVDNLQAIPRKARRMVRQGIKNNLKATLKRVEKVRRYQEEHFPELSMVEMALLFCLSHPDTSTVIVGMKNRAQLQANLKVTELDLFMPEQLKGLKALEWNRDPWTEDLT